jgi:hypothetical protein
MIPTGGWPQFTPMARTPCASAAMANAATSTGATPRVAIVFHAT